MESLQILVLITLPVLIKANIDINMHITADNQNTNVEASLIGAQRWIINDVTMRQFAITKEKLKAGVQALAGSRPDDVFLRDPAGDFGNLFVANGINQTTTVLKPITHSVTKLQRNIYLHDTKYILNALLDQEFNITVNISSNFQDLTTNTWSGVPASNSGVPISYRIQVNQIFPLIYSGIWGVRGNVIRDLLHDSGTRFLTPSDTDFHIDLYDRRVSVRVTVVYRTTLEGMAIGYWRGPAGPSFQVFDVNDVLMRSGIPLTVDSEESINMEHLTGTVFVLRYGNHTLEPESNYTVTVLDNLK